MNYFYNDVHVYKKFWYTKIIHREIVYSYTKVNKIAALLTYILFYKI